ncbi:unnamed protein product [Prunus armeniaca]
MAKTSRHGPTSCHHSTMDEAGEVCHSASWEDQLGGLASRHHDCSGLPVCLGGSCSAVEGVLHRGVCPHPMYFERLSGNHVFCESESFLQARAYEKYAEVCVCKAKLFHNFSQNDHVWHVNVLEVSGWWEDEVGNGSLVPIT